MNEHHKRILDPYQERMTKNIEENGPSGVRKEDVLGKPPLDDLITRDVDLTKLKG